VAGAPTEEALAFLREHETFPRGWYAGGVGVVGPDGAGEAAVAIRSALLTEDQTLLYAGAGIVAQSVPREELEETARKLEAMERVLS
jgi:menaquinone-specific isochorismate synthase